jgi:hypothetical protein
MMPKPPMSGAPAGAPPSSGSVPPPPSGDEGSVGAMSPEKTRAVIIMALGNLKKIAEQNGLNLSELLSEAGLSGGGKTPPILKE